MILHLWTKNKLRNAFHKYTTTSERFLTVHMPDLEIMDNTVAEHKHRQAFSGWGQHSKGPFLHKKQVTLTCSVLREPMQLHKCDSVQCFTNWIYGFRPAYVTAHRTRQTRWEEQRLHKKTDTALHKLNKHVPVSVMKLLDIKWNKRYNCVLKQLWSNLSFYYLEKKSNICVCTFVTCFLHLTAHK